MFTFRRRASPKRRAATLIAAAAAVALCSCSESRDEHDYRSPSIPAPRVHRTEQSEQERPLPEGSTISIDELVRLGLDNNSSCAAADADQRIARADIQQARAWANPALEVEVGKSRPRDGGDGIGTHEVSLSQRFELPGKRSSRIAASHSALQVAASERSAFRASLIADLRQAALEVIRCQEAVALAEQTSAVASEVLAAVQRRVDAGESDRAELLRAQVEQLRAEQQTAERKQDLSSARIAVNVLTGRSLPTTFTVTEPRPPTPAAASLSEALSSVPDHPDVAHKRAALYEARAAIRRENSAWQPDLTIGGFYAHEADTNDAGVSVGIDVPLWNRNQGGIASARAMLARAEADLRQAELAAAAAIEIAWQRVEAARARVDTYAGKLSERSQEALSLALARYEAGEADFLEVLDARRNAAAVADDALAARIALHAALITLDQAIGSTGDHP